MFGIQNFEIFIIAAILLNLTPGPDTLYIIGRSISQGRGAGIASALGISSGCLVHTLAAGIGLSAILTTSAIAFMAVKYIGAAYLVYLGIQMLLSNNTPVQTDKSDFNEDSGFWRIFRQGVVTNVLNPKVALFFLSFLPQFVSDGYNGGFLPFFILGITFIITGTIWCFIVVMLSSSISRLLSSNSVWSRYINRITGSLFIGLGLKLAFSKSN